MINTIEREPMLKEQVLKTTDYHLFSLISGNRKVNMAHVKRLERSFQKRQLFSPIIVNEHYQIIDGQHRFSVCQKLKLPIHYIVVEGYGLDEVQVLNTNSSNWKRVDYLNAYCDLGYPEYLKFKRFSQRYPMFGFQIIELILTNKSSFHKRGKNADIMSPTNKSGSYVAQRTFEEGEFRCEDYELSCLFAEKLISVKDFAPNVFNRRGFVCSMLQLQKNRNFEWDEFMKKLSQQPTSLVECVNISQYKSLIEEIYNWKRQNKINLRF
jgi:hypothetical protein